MSSATLENVQLIGVEPDPITFGTCGPRADVRKSFTEPLIFGAAVGLEYELDGQRFSQSFSSSGDFPRRLRNRNTIMEFLFTTNRLWTWTLKKGATVQ